MTIFDPVTSEQMRADYAAASAAMEYAHMPRGPLRIMKEVAFEHDVTVSEICGPCRLRNIVKARFKVYHRLQTELGLTTTRTGQLVGGRDHTTVMHGVRRYNEGKDT